MQDNQTGLSKLINYQNFLLLIMLEFPTELFWWFNKIIFRPVFIPKFLDILAKIVPFMKNMRKNI